MKLFNIVGILIILIIGLLIFKKYYRSTNLFEDIWYINLDRSVDRKDNMERQLFSIPHSLPVYRWPGVDGSKMTNEDYNRLEIPAWSRPVFTVEKRQKTRKGEIGCYLSHLNLMRELEKHPAHPEKGHLILEDDIHIDPDFFTKVKAAAKDLPNDWDIVTFGVPEKEYKKNSVINVRGHIGRTVDINNDYAYLVRHKSLRKIINEIAVIREPIDNTLGRASRLGNLNIYSYVAPLVVPREKNDTTMNG